MKNLLISKKALLPAAVLLAIIICTCPILRPVDVELQGAAYNTQDLQRIQDVTLRLKGHQRLYLLRDDVLDVTLQINDQEMEFDNKPFYFPEDGLYYAYFHFYEPMRNHYVGAKLVYDKHFYNMMVVIDEDNVIYTASINDAATQEIFGLPKPFVRFLDDYR